MQVQSIECQLTQAQLKRYLAGADFPDEILGALERHLKVCPDCMDSANRQREALGGAPAAEGQAVVVAQPKNSPFAKLKALKTGASKAPTPPKGLVGTPGKDPYADPLAAFKSPKNLILSGSLAIVLVLMSTVLRNPTGLLGPRATNTIKFETTAESTSGSDEKVAEKAVADPVTTKTPPPVVDAKSDETHSAETTLTSHPKASTTSTDKATVEPIGGEVLVAEAGGTKPVVSKKPAVTKVPVVKKPIVKKIVTPAVKKTPTKAATPIRRPIVRKYRPTAKIRAPRPRGVMRVYNPDGTVKH